MSLKIKDERAVLIKDSNGAYSDTDKEMWLSALGATDIGIIFDDNSGGAYLVATFTDGLISAQTLQSGFGNVNVHMRGGNARTVDYPGETAIPVYLVDYLEILNSPM